MPCSARPVAGVEDRRGMDKQHARRLALRLGIATLVAMAAVSARNTVFDFRLLAAVCLRCPGVLLTAQVPLLVIVASAVFFWSSATRCGASAVPARTRPFFVGLHRPVHHGISLPRAARGDDLGCRSAAAEPAFHVGRRPRDRPNHPDLYGLGVLGVSGQGRRARLSLMESHSPLWKRLAWMGGIWLASVLALAGVAGVLRLWLKT